MNCTNYLAICVWGVLSHSTALRARLGGIFDWLGGFRVEFANGSTITSSGGNLGAAHLELQFVVTDLSARSPAW